jgi:hypothetical protein
MRPSYCIPHAPGLSHSLPAENCFLVYDAIGVIHKLGYWHPVPIGVFAEIWPLALAWMEVLSCGRSEDLRTDRAGLVKTEVTTVGG